MPTTDDLKILQGLNLYSKVLLTKARIREFLSYYSTDQCYISFSGGKDSTVLVDIVRQVDPRVKAVFADTGLEYPELKEHVKSFDNVDIVRPKYSFKEVLHKFGYPVLSKQIAKAINTARKTPTGAVMKNRFIEPKNKGSMYDFSKYKPLVDADLDFEISSYCCDAMKKQPLKKIKGYPIIGTMAVEGIQRRSDWLTHGCNIFEGSHISCRPMSFWTENDIYEYTVQNNLKQCSVYGDFTCEGCTGQKRTGCIYCAFGAHLNNDQRYVLLKQTHPQLYNYCMKDLGFEHVLRTIEKVMGKEMYNL